MVNRDRGAASDGHCAGELSNEFVDNLGFPRAARSSHERSVSWTYGSHQTTPTETATAKLDGMS